jgi:hypothetical protein
MLESGLNDHAPIKPKVTTHQIVATDLAECVFYLETGRPSITYLEGGLHTQQSQPPARGGLPFGRAKF